MYFVFITRGGSDIYIHTHALAPIYTKEVH